MLALRSGYACSSSDSDTSENSSSQISPRLKGDEEKTDNEGLHLHLKPLIDSSVSDIRRNLSVCAAPVVESKKQVALLHYVDPNTKELVYNPTYEQLFAPDIGAENPFKTEQERAARNIVSGYVEPAHVNSFHFENERKTFHLRRYGHDPSNDLNSGNIFGDLQNASALKESTAFETDGPKNPKRKREKNIDPSDVSGYLGPWSKFADEETVSQPTDEEKIVLDDILAKRAKRSKVTQNKTTEEKSTLHIKDAYDYQGRSFLVPPQSEGVNLKLEAVPEKCYLPKKLLHTWTGHSKAVSAIRLLPESGHLLLSCGMDSKIKIWEVYGKRRCVRTYLGHKQAVRDVNFNNGGDQFLSASFDRYVKLWDTETGQCLLQLTHNKIPYCVKFNPDEDKQHLIVAGMSDKKIICWDLRTKDVVQEYDRHLGAVNTITFIDENRRFVSTSDDKSLRVWEWDIPVDWKYIAEPSMHSMPAVTLSPNKKWLACQAMDNQIMIFNAMSRCRLNRKKVFKGHMVAGYACGLDFSPDLSYLVSGDADGKIVIWDWKTTKLFNRFKAHDGVCIQVLWHPHETSKVISAGWDNLIKLWD